MERRERVRPCEGSELAQLRCLTTALGKYGLSEWRKSSLGI